MGRISVFSPHIFEAAVQSGKSMGEVLALVRSWGIDALDCDISNIRNAGFMAEARAAGLEISSVYGHFGFQNGYDENDAQTFIDDSKEAGAKTVLAVAGFTEDGSRLDAITDGLSRLCEYAEKSMITVTLEDFDDKAAPFSTSDGLLYFLDKIPALRCTFDTGNFVYSGESELEAYEKLRGKIVHVHCKDRSLSAKRGETPKLALDGTALYSSSVGGGFIEIAEIIKRLERDGYGGFYAIEHFGSSEQLSDMESSAAWLKEIT